jgi:hypothetical protein
MVEENATCRIRALHASPGTPNIDVWVDGTPAITNLAFGQVGAYAEIPAGQHQVQVYPAGTAVPTAPGAASQIKPLTAGGEGFAADQSHTVAILGKPQEARVTVLVDTTPAAGPNRAKARFLQAAPGAGAMDVSIARGPMLFKDVAFGQATAYAEVPAGTHTLVVRPAGGGFLFMFSLRDQQFAAGSLYTFVALGMLYDEPRLEVVPIVDKPAENKPTK